MGAIQFPNPRGIIDDEIYLYGFIAEPERHGFNAPLHQLRARRIMR
jgi:hypothetical protein